MKDGDLIVGIMASLGRADYAAGELLALSRPFAVTPASLRTNLSRLAKKGVLVKRSRAGKTAYGFSAKGAAITANVAAGFRDPEWSGWDGSFWGVLFSLPAGDKNGRYRLTKKLSLYRFAPLYPGFWLRPFRERERLERKLEGIFGDGRCRAIRFHPVRPLSKTEVGKLWNVAGAAAAMRGARERARALLASAGRLSPADAFAERYRAGGIIVDALFRDPLLPPVFLPAGWPAGELRRLFAELDARLARRSRPFWESILGDSPKKGMTQALR